MGNETIVNSSIDFFWHIYVPIAIWLVLIMVLLSILLYRYTFGKWSPDSPNPYSGESLSVPRGTFRSILTLSLLFVAVLLETWNVSIGANEENIYEFMTAFKMMIAFYFGAKVAHHVSSTDRHKAQMKADAMVGITENTNEQPTEEEVKEGDPALFEDPESAG